MSDRLLLRVTAPAVAVGLLLFTACLASVGYMDRLQTSLAAVLARNVTSLQAAQELEIRVRQLRFHTLLYLMDPEPGRLRPVEVDHHNFEEALETARSSSADDRERELVEQIAAAYRHYRREQANLRSGVVPDRPVRDFPRVADAHPIALVVEPCQELLRRNKDRMSEAADEGRRVSRQGRLVMLFLGLAGPVGGLVLGFGVARGLRHSITRLSVRVQDVAQRLDRDVASVSVVADGDMHDLDRQMQHIVRQVEAVTERQRQQERELLRAEQLAAVGQLAASVAHEVRNPLTGIKMLVEAALRPRHAQPLNDEDLRVIHGEVVRLEGTVQNFLNFARLPPPQRAPCDLREVLAQAAGLTRARAEQQAVAVAVQVPPVAVVAAVDAGQLRTVLVNLFLNALDAMPHGGRLDVVLEPPDQGAVRLTVRDTGGGIPAHMAGRLFTPFATTKPTGTGLGLSLSKRILEEHGGSIGAANHPNGGACFTLSLPTETQAPP
jgi:signal transduction histidine kinase